MKKTILTLVAVLCCVMTMMAEPVSPDVAQQAAAKFLQARGASLESGYMQARGMSRNITGTVQTETSPYYVFNATDSRGFVIVSGDDCVGDNLVLGYTSQGSFDENSVPDNMKWWLDEMATQISTLSSCGAKATAVPLHQDIAPMITAKWNQNVPYNAFCPETDGKLCLTGCMATALAQVMYYHRWPQEPIANDLPTYTMANGRVIDGLPVTSFDWDNMVDDYKNTTTTEEQQNAVAKLMRYCGQTIQMDYTPTLSLGAYYDTDLLVNCFGYDPGVYWAQYGNYSVSSWDELLYNELREGRPLIYAGTSIIGGHAFVLDGYEVQNGEGYYSVNWGWGGDENGFYKINLLSPYKTTSGVTDVMKGFSRFQRALIGLQPRKDPSAEFHRYLSSFDWNIQDEDIEHEFVMVNPSYRPGTFTIGLAERNDDGTPDISRICYTKDYEASGYDFGKFDTEDLGKVFVPLTEEFFSNLSSGNHKLVFVNRESKSDAPWQLIYGPAAYIEVNIGDGGEVKEMTIHPQAQLTASASDISIEGLKQRCISQVVTATIHNNSATDDYMGGIECLACYVENGELIDIISNAKTGALIEAGGTSEVSYKISVPYYGDYVFLLAEEDYITSVDDIKGVKLDDIGQLPGYVGYKNVTFDQLAFECLGAMYNEDKDEQDKPIYQIGVILGNGTPMDYDAVLMIDLYKLNDEGKPEPVVPDTVMLYSKCKIVSGTYNTTFIKLPEHLESGSYVFDIYIANDFHSMNKDDYFVLNTCMIEVAGPTEIETVSVERSAVSGQRSAVSEAGAWHDLFGRKLPGKPTAPGWYINDGKKIAITR